MRWVLIAGLLVVVLAGAVVVLGLLRPATHVATHSALLAAPPERVWALIADVERTPEWLSAIRSVERLPDRDGRPSYQEDFSGFKVTTVITAAEPPRRLVKEILPGAAFHGSWTWELEPVADGTRLTITERGTVPNPFIRGLVAFQDPTKAAREYAAALAHRLER